METGKGATSVNLLERENELTTIAERLDAACVGEGSLTVLEGPAGIGKSVLLRATVAMARDRGMLVLKARGGLLEQGFEYGVVRQLVERAVIGADPERRAQMLAGPASKAEIALGLSEPPPDAGPGRDSISDIEHGLHWLVANLSAEQPVLLATDDAQWGDFASLRAGGYLAQRLEGMAVMMLVSVRDDEPSPAAALLREMLGATYPTYLNPAPLGVESAEAILEEAFDDAPPPGLVEACLHASGGNPFFLTELARELGRSGRPPGEIRPESVGQAGPLAVRRSILLRIGQLGPAARSIAEAVTVLGGEGELAHAAAVAGLDREAAAAAADELADAGILDRRRPLRIKQPLVRSAIDEDIGPAEQAAAHRRAFEVLSDSGADEDTLAVHAMRAEVTGDPRLIAVLRRTADRALRTGHAETAAAHLRRALAEGPPDGDRADLLAELGRAEVREGDFGAGLGHLDGALELISEPAAQLAVLRDQAFATFASEGMDSSRDLVAGALAELPAAERESDAALQLRADVALLEWLTGSEPSQDLDRFRAVAGATPAERTVLALLSQQELCAANDPDAAVELAQRALGDGRMIAEDTSESLGWYLATYALMACEALGPARTTIEQAIADGHRRGSAFARAGALGCRAVLALNEGRPRDAEADARAAAAGGLPPTMVLANSAYIAMALVDQGDLDGAWDEVVAAGFEHGPGGPTVLRFAPWARARIHELRGDTDAVRADLAPLRDDDAAGMPMRALAWRALLARTLARDPNATSELAEEARTLAAEHLDWAQGWRRPAALGIAQRAVALAAPSEQRATLLFDAVATLSASPHLSEEGRARAELGVALLRDGRRKDGRAELERALAIVHEVGDRPLAERIAGELEIAGAAPKRLSFDEMTASERRVALLAADGKTNKEIAGELFVTPKTVENHLTRVYAKLGVNSRRALVDAL